MFPARMPDLERTKRYAGFFIQYSRIMKKILPLFLLLFISISSFAQTDLDAFRYSQSNLSGTSRFTSMGGAFGALGGDFSCLAANPAGIAIYRKSEISFTPSVFIGSTESNFLGKTNTERRFNFNFGNAGAVFTHKLTENDEGSGWKSWNFGFGYNRINNFHNRSFYENTNPKNSLTNYFAENAQGTGYENLDPFYEYLAYYTYLINPDSVNNYSSAVPNGNIVQRRSSETRGSMGETNISFGGNYSNRLFLGGSIGFANIRYLEETTFEEIDKENVIDTLNQFQFDQNLTTRGFGFNFKFGMIYRAADWVRLGATIHTPTWYSMHDDYNSTMKAKFDGGYSDTKDSPDGSYDYTLTTPFKAIGSLAFIIGKYGLISGDYEFSDYSEARLDAVDATFADANDVIRNKYTSTSPLRVGAEYRIGNYSLRGGTAFTSSPLNTQYIAGGADFKKTSYGGGIGIRDKDLFVDIGYMYTESNEYFQPYTLRNQDVPGVKNKARTNNVTITFGVRF